MLYDGELSETKNQHEKNSVQCIHAQNDETHKLGIKRSKNDCRIQ